MSDYTDSPQGQHDLEEAEYRTREMESDLAKLQAEVEALRRSRDEWHRQAQSASAMSVESDRLVASWKEQAETAWPRALSAEAEVERLRAILREIVEDWDRCDEASPEACARARSALGGGEGK